MAMISETNRIINSTKTKPITDVTKLDPNKEYDLTEEGYVEYKDPTKEKWYTASEAAKEAGVSSINIRCAIYSGRLLATQIPDSSRYGFHYMIRETDLIEWMEDKSAVRNPKAHEEYNRKTLERTKSESNQEYIPVDENGVQFMPVHKAAERIGRSSSFIRNAINNGELKATKGFINSHHAMFISEADLMEFVSKSEKLIKSMKRVKALTDAEEAPRTIMYDPISGQQFITNEEAIKEANKEIAAQFELERERHYAQSLKDAHEIDPKMAVKLDVLMAHIQALIDNSYKKGFEDGKLSVEFDKSDEYGRGVEEGKKQAKEELLAKLAED